MQQSIDDQFASASVSPRSIAWLARPDEMERLEQIINYNCAMIGGIFNVIIPITQHGISPRYQQFLFDYDPDLVVLAEGDKESQLNTLPRRLNPYAIIGWENVSAIATLTPMGYSSDQNTPISLSTILPNKPELGASWRVAVASSDAPDLSLLALIACGDVAPEEPQFYMFDEIESMDATGFRELLLRTLANSEQSNAVSARFENGQVVAGPTRGELLDVIKAENAFPLFDPFESLKTCDSLQSYPETHKSLIGLTTQYGESAFCARIGISGEQARNRPAVVILVSEHFGFDQATMFWNLRARGVRVFWLSFENLQQQSSPIFGWLQSDLGAGSLGHLIRGNEIVFSAAPADRPRVQQSINELSGGKGDSSDRWSVLSHEDLIVYDITRPVASYEHIAVVQHGSNCGFIPKFKSQMIGTLALTIEWARLLLPTNQQLIGELVSTETESAFGPFVWGPNGLLQPEPIKMPKMRITKDRHVRLQVRDASPVHFNKPSATDIFRVLFKSAGLRMEPSSAARYHQVFVERASTLGEAAKYLAVPPYRQLLENLADNIDKSRPGWILEHPDKRRVLHHLDLRSVLQSDTPESTRQYFDTVCDQLPVEAAHLLERRLLERGFLIRCSTCSYSAWYPVQNVGQSFECNRCFETQVYKANPVWLYKLPEVVFQGFADNMQVPLLALHYLNRTSRKAFEWVPDADIYFGSQETSRPRNIDILCLRDGKIYIGEAKSNDHLDSDKLALYETLLHRVEVDGLVFATTKEKWDQSTMSRIKELSTDSTCQVLALTAADLYGR